MKIYPDGSRTVMVADRAIFREPGWEDAGRWEHGPTPEQLWEAFVEAATTLPDVEKTQYQLAREEEREEERAADNLGRAQRRARAAVRDIALSNPFRWFVTLTLDQSKIDRYNVTEITRHLNHWLDNQVRRAGLAYVLVPERHQDGAIHFHGLFSDALRAVDSGTIDRGAGKPRKPRSKAQREAWLAGGGHVVYNLPAWGWGYTTAIELYGDRRKAVNYVTKYIGKQMQPDEAGGLRPGKIGGRWYYSGGALRRPEVALCDIADGDFDALSGFEFEIAALGCRAKILDVEGGGQIEASAATSA